MDLLSDLHATHLLSPFSMNCVTFWIVAATMEATLFEGILKNTTILWRKIRNERIYLLCSVISVLFYPRRNLTLLCVGLVSDCWTRKRLDKDNWFVEITTRDRVHSFGTFLFRFRNNNTWNFTFQKKAHSFWKRNTHGAGGLRITTSSNRKPGDRRGRPRWISRQNFSGAERTVHSENGIAPKRTRIPPIPTNLIPE